VIQNFHTFVGIKGADKAGKAEDYKKYVDAVLANRPHSLRNLLELVPQPAENLVASHESRLPLPFPLERLCGSAINVMAIFVPAPARRRNSAATKALTHPRVKYRGIGLVTLGTFSQPCHLCKSRLHRCFGTIAQPRARFSSSWDRTGDSEYNRAAHSTAWRLPRRFRWFSARPAG